MKLAVKSEIRRYIEVGNRGHKQHAQPEGLLRLTALGDWKPMRLFVIH